MWEFSSVGRASALQAGGHRFEPYNSHHFIVYAGVLVVIAKTNAIYAGVAAVSAVDRCLCQSDRKYAGVAQW